MFILYRWQKMTESISFIGKIGKSAIETSVLLTMAYSDHVMKNLSVFF